MTKIDKNDENKTKTDNGTINEEENSLTKLSIFAGSTW